MQQAKHHRRHAFTMIELMVVIAIILILIGIVFVAIKHVSRSATQNSTKVDLQNLQSMLGELETAGDLSTTIQFPVSLPYPATPYTVKSILPPQPAAIPYRPAGDVTASAYSSNASTDRWQSLAVYSTQFVMGRLRSVPANRQMLQNLPGERLMKAQTDGPAYGAAAPSTTAQPIRTLNGAANGTPDPPILVDAWNNPIIFVPAGGLQIADAYSGTKFYKVGSVVQTGSSPNYVYYRALKANVGAPVTDTTNWEQLPTGYNGFVTAPGNRPFWASAGPDGDFQTPDDNMYSFEQ